MAGSARQPRFLTLADVAEILNTSTAQVNALIHREELKAVRIGGRGQWRVEVVELEAYIQRAYADAQSYLRGHGSTRSAQATQEELEVGSEPELTQ